MKLWTVLLQTQRGTRASTNTNLLLAVDDTVSLITVVFASSVVVLIKMPLSPLLCTALMFTVAVSVVVASVVVVVVVLVVFACSESSGFEAIVMLLTLLAAAAIAGSSGVSGVGKMAVLP